MRTRGRGRPPHPDILTPREWEVLQLIEEGLTNEQIGERLGISSDGAKFHVAQILSKLGVSRRHEAPSIAYANRGRLVRRWAFLPFFGKLGASKTANTVAAGGVVAASVIALVALFFALRGQAGEPFDMYPGLYVLDLSSGEVNRLVDLRPGDGRRVEWTKDGKGLLMIHELDSSLRGSTKLRRFDAKTGLMVAEDDLNFDQLSYSVLADGRLGVLWGREDTAQNGDLVSTNVAGVMDPATMLFEAKRTINTRSAIESYWSPDGNSVITAGPLQPDMIDSYQLVDLRSDAPLLVVQPRFWSPDGSRYLTTAAQPGSSTTGAVVEIRADTTNAILATIDFGPTAVSGAQPKFLWSPDSRWVLSVGTEDLFLAAADGSTSPRSLAKGSFYYSRFNTESAGPGWPTWSPDSQSIAFLDDDNVLQRVEIASGIIEPLYEPPLPFLAEPRWSPDGTKIAFRVADIPSIHIATLDGESEYVASGNLTGVSPRGDRLALSYGPNVYTIRPNGRSLTALSDFDNSYLVFTDRMGSCFVGPRTESAAWSPDGKWLLHTRMNENDLDEDVTVRVRSNRLAPDEGGVLIGSSLTWSPNAKVTAHKAPSPSIAPDPSTHSCSVVLTDVASGQIMVQLPGSGYEWVGEDHLLVWNMGTSTLVGPDGLIVREFDGEVAVSPKLDRALFMPEQQPAMLMDIASGATVKTFPEHTRAAAWFSPDGKILALQNRTTGRLDLLDPVTGSVTRTLEFGGSLLFSPDSRKLAYKVFVVCCEETLYVLDLTDPRAVPQKIISSRTIRERVWSPESTHLAFTYLEQTQAVSPPDNSVSPDTVSPPDSTVAPGAVPQPNGEIAPPVNAAPSGSMPLAPGAIPPPGTVPTSTTPETSSAIPPPNSAPSSVAPIAPRVPEPSGRYHLVILDIGSTKQTHIADNASRVEWFPAGRRLVYQAD